MGVKVCLYNVLTGNVENIYDIEEVALFGKP